MDPLRPLGPPDTSSLTPAPPDGRRQDAAAPRPAGLSSAAAASMPWPMMNWPTTPPEAFPQSRRGASSKVPPTFGMPADSALGAGAIARMDALQRPHVAEAPRLAANVVVLRQAGDLARALICVENNLGVASAVYPSILAHAGRTLSVKEAVDVLLRAIVGAKPPLAGYIRDALLNQGPRLLRAMVAQQGGRKPVDLHTAWQRAYVQWRWVDTAPQVLRLP